MRVHLFPYRTQKLSSCTPTILGGRLPGKIGNANTETSYESRRFFCADVNRWPGPPVSVCGARHLRRRRSAVLICRPLHTLRPCLFRHRRRSGSRPYRTQKLSSCTPTILGGRLPGKIGNANTETSYESRRFFAPGTVPRTVPAARQYVGLPRKIDNANTIPHYFGSEVFLCLQASLRTLAGGMTIHWPPVAVPDIFLDGGAPSSAIDRCHSIRSLNPPLAALPSLPGKKRFFFSMC